MQSLAQDVRFGFRTLAKDRASAFMAVLALALGIGSTTAIFSVIDNVLIEPFPYTGAGRLVEISIHDSTSPEPYGRGAFVPPELLDYQQQTHVFEESIGIANSHVLWSGKGAPESWNAASVTGNSFDFLGMKPLLGRYASPSDARPNAAPVFVMSYKLWQKRFNADPQIIGKSFTLDDTPRTLIGIMPKRFALWGADLWIPVTPDPADKDFNAQYFVLLGRLRPGLKPAIAASDVNAVAHRISKAYPLFYPKKFDVRLETLTDNVVGKFSQTLYALLAAVFLLLLIACGNVANLLLAKATAREKEFAIRNSLGAGRARILRQLFIESLVLAAVGALFGCCFAWAGLRALMAALPAFTFPDEAVITLNVRVLMATIAIAAITALLFGLAPAIGGFSRNLHDPLKSAGRGNSGFRRGKLRNALIVSEVALSMILLTGAGLMMRSFFLARTADLGLLKPDRLVIGDISLSKKYKTLDQQNRFIRELTARLQSLPGVLSASGVIDFPPFGGINTEFDLGGKTHSEKLKGQVGFADAAFFRTVGTRLQRGRYLSEDDVKSARKVAVINNAMSRQFFGGEDPVGKRIKIARLEQLPLPVNDPWFEVVGVSSDIRNHGVQGDIVPEAYAPITITAVAEYAVYVRTLMNPAPIAKALEGEVLAMDKSLQPQTAKTLEAALNDFEYAKPRFALQLFSVFAGVGLILVSVGIYSVVAYTVSQQQREIGIRMALGASRGIVRRWVILAGMRYIALGVAFGAVASLFLLRLMKSQITGVATYDPLTMAGVVAMLALVGLGACYVPSRRATRVDPMVSLRWE